MDNISPRPVLRLPVIDDRLHLVVVPLGNGIRVAGMAELTGYDLSPSTARIRALLRATQQLLPHEKLETDSIQGWFGLRPVSADGVPIIGATPLDNLYVNSGHGHLGWTLAAGSAEVMSHLFAGTTSIIDAEQFSFSRFGASR
jgi:D-amino-acid dehydrogenase